MKSGIFCFLLIFLLSLMGCSNPYSIKTSNVNDVRLTKEYWIKRVNTDPNLWIPKNISPWYFTGEPASMQSYVTSAPVQQAVTVMSVNTAPFTKIRIDGDFQVQISGMEEQNSVYIVGSNSAAREIVTEFKGQTVFIHPVADSKVNLKNVIVRIGVRNLDMLTNLGKATILGRYITSTQLKINNCDDGCIILKGQMNILKITQAKSGKVIIIGACSPNLDIDVQESGSVNVSGRVGVRDIKNKNGQVNIIGADSNALTITASGASITKIVGKVNLKCITASNKSCIYVYWVCSTDLIINAKDDAKIGVAGNAAIANINLKDNARLGGQYLYGQDVYIKTKDSAHANISAKHKLFSAATGDSSIYYFGSPTLKSSYTSQSGLIVPIR